MIQTELSCLSTPLIDFYVQGAASFSMGGFVVDTDSNQIAARPSILSG